MARGPVSQNTVVLNRFGLERLERTTKSGTKARYAVTIQAEPVLVNLDAKMLGANVAATMANVIREKIRAISAQVKPATLKYRERAKNAFQRGETWAMKRYSGGKLGPKQPGQSDRLYNDSGRLADGIFARAAGKDPKNNTWVVNVPANRFDPRTFNGGEAAMVGMVERLQQFVPELGDIKKLFDAPEVRKAVEQSVLNILAKMKAGSTDAQIKAKIDAMKREFMRQLIELGKAVIDLGA